MIIAVDFDGTLCDHQFPEIGEEVPSAFKYLKRFQLLGAKLILWTMRSDMQSAGVSIEGHRADRGYLTEALDWCAKRGIHFWAANCNPEQRTWTTSPKVYANRYIDDAASGCPLVWQYTSRPYVDWAVVGPDVEKQIIQFFGAECLKIR